MSHRGGRSHIDPGRTVPGVSRSPMHGVALCLAQDSSFRDQTNGHIAPERDHQLARQSDDGDTPDTSRGIPNLLQEPTGQRTLRLMPDPEPREFDGKGSDTRIASFADPLIHAHGAAVEGARREPEVACNLTAVAEMPVEGFAGQCYCSDLTDAFQADERSGLSGTGVARLFPCPLLLF